MDGRPYTGPKLENRSMKLGDKTLLQDGGPRVRMEHYHSTTYLLQIGEQISEKYPYRFNVLHLDSGLSSRDSMDSMARITLTLIGIEYESQNVSLKIAANYCEPVQSP